MPVSVCHNVDVEIRKPAGAGSCLPLVNLNRPGGRSLYLLSHLSGPH